MGGGSGEKTSGERRGLGLEEARGAEVGEVGPRGLRRAGGGPRSVRLLWRVVRRHV